VTGNYWDFPTSSNNTPSNDVIDPDPGNNANFYQSGYSIGSPYYRTVVGEFENSDSPYGTFDQGGNVLEWDEAIISDLGSGFGRGLRGGSASSAHDVNYLLAAQRNSQYPQIESSNYGFRIVEVPEPASFMLLSLGGLAVLRRRRSA
jgi:formylglycine-generating enzyme required for sulfatase activity